MSKKTILILLFLWTTLGVKANDDYINRYKYIAISEMERTGIPASIKLAQALLESGAGKSTLAREANNHFGIKCGSKWKGKKHYRKDDDYKNGKLIKSCFRVYRNAEDSFYAHSAFLTDNKRYKDLFKISSSNYKRWAKGLKKAGYATSKTYDDKLIKLIEAYDLYRFDQMGSSDKTARPNMRRKKNSELFYINDAKAVFAKSGDTPRKIAERTKTSLERILKYNEELQFPSQIIKEEEKVFIQKKRKNFRGKKRTHDVEEGETMYDIAQEYGLRLDKLYKKNKMKSGTQPAVGEPVQIRGKAKKQPRLRNSTPVVKPPPIAVPPPVIVTEEPPRTESWEEEPVFETPVVEEPEESPFIEFEEEEAAAEEPIFEESPIYNPQTTGTGGNTSTYPETTTVPIYESEEKTTTESEVVIPPYISDPVERTLQYHTVQKGETLWRISQNYGTTVDAIKRMNNLQSNIISVGMQLRVK